MNWKKTFQGAVQKGIVKERYLDILSEFSRSLIQEGQKGGVGVKQLEKSFSCYLNLVLEYLNPPFKFQPYHNRITHPFDHTQFTLDFIRPLIDLENSLLLGIENLQRMQKQLQAGDNVILFANHQVEPDPQAIQLLLDPEFKELGREMIFVAGDRVTSDPLAVPFSMGCNLICIHSKKRMNANSGERGQQQQHNQKAMTALKEILIEGGKCIYVALSGGRDRKNEQGELEISHFDPQSLEMFRLIAKQSQQYTHFYPLSLLTYDLLPPPSGIEKELGETRILSYTPVKMFFGEELDLERFDHTIEDKQELRVARAKWCWKVVKDNYDKLLH